MVGAERIGGELLVLFLNACFGRGQRSPCDSTRGCVMVLKCFVCPLSLSFLLHIPLCSFLSHRTIITTINTSCSREKNKGVGIEVAHYLGDGLWQTNEIQ